MNYSELTTAIQDFSTDNDDATFVDNIPVFIANAEKRIYQAVKLPALRKNATSNLTINNKYLTLPTDYLSTWEIAAIVGTTYSYLLPKDVSFIREAYPDTAIVGTPKYYAQFDADTLLLGPTPDALISVELHYFYYPESIVTAGTTWLGDNYSNLLLYASMIEAAVFMKSEEDTMKAYTKQFSVDLKLLSDYAEGQLRSLTYRR